MMIEIVLKYDPVIHVYEAWINASAHCHADPFKAIKLALENHNCNVHEEMYQVLKEIQESSKSVSLTDIDEVIKRYESK